MASKLNVKKAMRAVGGAACAVSLSALPAGASEHYGPAQSLCAVSGFNGKLEGAGGFIDQRSDDGGRGHALLSLSAPLGCMFGMQVDLGIGDLAGSTAGGVAGHLFKRDPQSYLIGAYGQWGAVGGQDVWRIGGEAELYRGNISYEFLAGFEDTDRTSSDVFAALDIAFYTTDNLRLSAGYRRLIKVDAAAVGLEWQPGDLNLGLPVSFFVKGAVGSKGYGTAYGGVRLYFGGPQKSLIRRHREDDPGAKGIFDLLQENMESVTPVVPVAPPPKQN